MYYCLHQPKAEGRLCFRPCPSVRVSVRASVLQVCPQLISGAVGPIAAKLSTHTRWMPIQNLCPTFFTWACFSATRRQIFIKLTFGKYSYRFCPKITHIS